MYTSLQKGFFPIRPQCRTSVGPPPLRTTLFLCTLILASLALARADGPRWRSFGSFEIRMIRQEIPVTVRMISYANGESMAEKEERGVRRQRLTVRPSGLALFSGRTEEDLRETDRNDPFSFTQWAFPYPLTVLEAAFPSGPESVPEETEETDLMLEGKYPATLQTARPAPDTITFHLIRREGGRVDAIDGVWQATPGQPLPDDFPLTGWDSDSAVPLNTLGEARSFKRTHKGPQ
jgi:hypothetical protein